MQKVKLNELCTMQSGGTPSRSKNEYYNGTIPWSKISDLEKSNDGYIYETEEYITNDGLKSINNRFFEKGTLLLAMYGSVGKTAIAKIDLSTNQAILGINIKDEKKLDIKYLRYWFTTIKEQLLNRAVGAALSNISLGIVKELEIPLPDLPTQQKIAAILDKADELRQYNQQLIDKYDALTQSLFLDMFGDPVKNEKGWETKYLGDLCDVGSSRRVFVDDLVEIGVPFYRGTEIGQMSLDDNINPTLFITEEHYKRLKKETGVPKIGDLLMPSICPDGRIFEVTNDNPFYFKDGRVLWIKVNDKLINSIYLKKHLKAIFAVDYDKIASGTTFAELKIFALKKINLHYPPLDLQNQFADRIILIDAQKHQAQEALAKSELLFEALLKQAFNGELS